LDGVIESPEKWSIKYWNDDIAAFKDAELLAADAHLLGRVTYQNFAAAWPSRTGEFADRMNKLPKYVVSTTLKRTEWENSHVIGGDVAQEIDKLKQRPGQDILVAGSCTLVQTLVKHDLIDEYHLLIYPVVLGAGKRLFEAGATTTLELLESKSYATGALLMRYAPKRGA
jgi:dihydrofolate reductase